jgi:putative Ca2+/H+ antiporter (TMEM165/GDT1 family)
LEAFLTSLTVVAVAEIGDRTQLLALFLASQFRRPVPILAGILLATVANHAAAALAGEWLGDLLTPGLLRWVLGISFLAMAGWMLVPDRLEEKPARGPRHGAFLTTLVGFFLCEMGDKTQIATAALAARFGMLLPVVIGTTLGMMLANTPAVLFGHYAVSRLSTSWTRYIAAAIFALEAAFTFAGYGGI